MALNKAKGKPSRQSVDWSTMLPLAGATLLLLLGLFCAWQTWLIADESNAIERVHTAQKQAVKAVSELYSPVAGEIVEVNGALDADPAVVNRDPYGEGWMVKVRTSASGALDSLLDAAGYRAHIGE